jgi:hypothetical protein
MRVFSYLEIAMALPTTLSPMGATITFATSAYAAKVLTFIPLNGASVATRDVTNLSSLLSRKKKPGKLIDWGTMTMTVQYDGTRPTMGVAETITILFDGAGSPDPKIAGTGYVSDFGVDFTGGDDEEGTATLEITWDGDTDPTFTA